MVLMLKPSVGLIVVMSSLFKRLTMVVFPALSKPLKITSLLLTVNMHGYQQMTVNFAIIHQSTYTIRSRISFSFCFTFFMMVSRPIATDRLKDCSRQLQVTGAYALHFF